MAELYTYNNVTHLTTVKDGEVELVQSAELGNVGMGRIVVEDTDGTIDIDGQKNVLITQDSCTLTVTFRGFVDERRYVREADPKVSASRNIEVSLVDLNAMLSFRLIRGSDGKRAAETVAARGAWLMAQDAVSGLFVNNGLCDFPTGIGMDKADYRNQFPGDVLADMALACGGYNYHIQDYGSGAELIFRNDNAQTSNTSSLRISNVLSDASSVTYHPKETVLTRRPGKVKSDLVFQYAKGNVHEERAATATTFNGERWGLVSNSHVRTESKARDEATSMLHQLSTEEDIIECTLEEVLAADVNLVMPGYRIQGKFSHLNTEGYGSFTWFRVLERRVKPLVAEGSIYDVGLKLSPQEAGPPEASIVQSVFGTTTEGGAYPEFANPVTPGNLLVFCASDRGVSNPGAPNTADTTQPSWGTGAWTEFPIATVELGSSYGNDGIAFWYKIADSTDRDCWIPQSNSTFGAWEITGADTNTANWDEVHESIQTGTPFNIGSLGNTSTGDVMLMCIAWGEEFAPPWPATPPNPPITYNSAWRQRRKAYSYFSWYDHHPWTWIGDAVGAHTGLEAEISRGSSKIFAGIALRIPAL